jgi:hypothetical protein
LKLLHYNINKALLPNIQNATSNKKSKSCETREKSNNEKKEKKFEFIHEEYYDPKCKGKFTIFNKYALEIEDENSKENNDQ